MCTFFLINLTLQAYCTTARGLKIDLQAKIRGRNKSDVLTISNLTDIEITASAHNNTIEIEEDVTYTFLSNDASFADADTDDDESAIQNSASQVVASIGESMPRAALDIQKLISATGHVILLLPPKQEIKLMSQNLMTQRTTI